MARSCSFVLLAVLAWLAPTARADAPPLCVVVLEAALDPADDSTIVLRARATRPDGVEVARELGRVDGACTHEVGGAESLSVVRCTLANGDEQHAEIVQVGARVLVDTHLTHAGGRAQRSRVLLTRSQRGWAVVPRCARTFDEPLACPPSDSPVVARPPVPHRVELTQTERNEESGRPTSTRHDVVVTDHAWGDVDRDDGWLRWAPAPMTLAAARAAPDVRVESIAHRPVAFRQADGGSLTYHFDARGRTVEVRWDPEADAREYVYRYTYAARSPGSPRRD
jgi:YD repeat-containing protein